MLDEKGNYYNNILGVNKEQQITYIAKEGTQTYRPYFTYHGFRYVRITGWPGRISSNDFKIHVFTSEMEDIGAFSTSDPPDQPTAEKYMVEPGGQYDLYSNGLPPKGKGGMDGRYYGLWANHVL